MVEHGKSNGEGRRNDATRSRTKRKKEIVASGKALSEIMYVPFRLILINLIIGERDGWLFLIHTEHVIINTDTVGSWLYVK